MRVSISIPFHSGAGWEHDLIAEHNVNSHCPHRVYVSFHLDKLKSPVYHRWKIGHILSPHDLLCMLCL